MNFLFVFLGGGLGSMCRYGIGLLLKQSQLSFPIATFTANAVSCLILGILLGISLKQGISDQYKLLLMTGFCGGFSTFSTFSAETFQLFEKGLYQTALFYIALSLIICLSCIGIGIWIAHKLS